MKYQHLTTPPDIIIEQFTSQRNKQKVESTRYISTKNVREIQHIVKTKHNIDIYIGSVHSLRPFYIQPPSEREKESCLCKFCLNLRLKFNELQRHL